MKKFGLSIFSVFMSFLMVINAFAAPMVPAQIQAALLGKIFALESRLQGKSNAELVMGVYYKDSDAESKKVQGDIIKMFTAMAGKLPGKPVSVKAITSIDEIAGLDIVYVTPGCEADLDAIIAACNDSQVLGVCGVEEYAKSGLALAIGIAAGKPKIFINKSAAEATGAKFVDQIVAIAKMI